MDVKLRLDPQSTNPIFQQIVDGLESLIIGGSLKSGTLLPSVRDFAVRHLVNPNTVSKAYQSLQSMGLIEPLRGLGLKVCKLDAKFSTKRRSELLIVEADRLISTAKSLQSTPSELIRLIQTRWKG